MATTTARVHWFDFGEETTKWEIAAYLNQQFGNRFVPHWGDFHETIPNSNLQCDLIFVDALHPQDIEVSIKHLSHADTEYLYHNGGAGRMKARDYLLNVIDSWAELATTNTSRGDGERCVYYLGKRQAGFNRASGPKGLEASGSEGGEYEVEEPVKRAVVHPQEQEQMPRVDA